MKKYRRKVKVIIGKISIVLGIITLLLVSIKFLILNNTSYISPIPKMLLSASKSGSSNLKNNIEMLLKAQNISYQSVNLEKNAYVVTLKNDEKIFLDTKKSLDSQISSLQLLISRLTIEGKHFKTLDFRYNKPVIMLKQ